MAKGTYSVINDQYNSNLRAWKQKIEKYVFTIFIGFYKFYVFLSFCGLLAPKPFDVVEKPPKSLTDLIISGLVEGLLDRTANEGA